MIVRVDPDYLEHASKSKYKGGFTKDGKNTSAYNHDYYIHNKEKWKGEDIFAENDYAPNPDKYDNYNGQYESAYADDYNKWLKKDPKHRKTIQQTTYTDDDGRRRVVNFKQSEIKQNKDSTWHNNKEIEVGGYLDSKDGNHHSRKRNIKYLNEDDNFNSASSQPKSATVYKRGEGIGGGPSGTKDYNNRSSVSVNKRKKGRKPVGKVWTAKY